MRLSAKVITLLVVQIQMTGVLSAAGFLPSNFTFWMWQSSIVVGNWLYIDGGEIWARWNGASTNASAVWNQQTIAIDLSSSWTTASVAIPFNVTNQTTAMSPERRPDLYYDPTKSMVYSLGGDAYQLNGGAYNVSVPVQLWGFKTGNDGHANWELQEVENAQSFPLTSNKAGALTATSPTGHYSLGGYINFDSGSLALTDMVSFNFTDQLWLNQTNSGLDPYHHFIHGRGQFVPTFGREGLVLFFGGNWPSDGTVWSSSAIIGLDTILVYDIFSNTFFKQTATNPPTGRFAFCSVAAGTTASANSSYEIFMYGGTTGNEPDNTTQAELSTVYILTLPAFHWLAAPVAASTWRSFHTCALIGNRQMVSIGGIHDQENWQTWNDPWTNSMGIFDLSALTWTDAYDHTAAAYEPSTLVTSYYAGNERYPKTWADGLQAIFEANTTSTSTPASSPGQSSTRAIAGGCVGGLLALAILGSAIFWYLRRKRRFAMSHVEMDVNPIARTELPSKADYLVLPPVIHEMPGSRPPVYELHSQGT